MERPTRQTSKHIKIDFLLKSYNGIKLTLRLDFFFLNS